MRHLASHSTTKSLICLGYCSTYTIRKSTAWDNHCWHQLHSSHGIAVIMLPSRFSSTILRVKKHHVCEGEWWNLGVDLNRATWVQMRMVQPGCRCIKCPVGGESMVSESITFPFSGVGCRGNLRESVAFPKKNDFWLAVTVVGEPNILQVTVEGRCVSLLFPTVLGCPDLSLLLLSFSGPISDCQWPS